MPTISKCLLFFNFLHSKQLFMFLIVSILFWSFLSLIWYGSLGFNIDINIAFRKHLCVCLLSCCMNSNSFSMTTRGLTIIELVTWQIDELFLLYNPFTDNLDGRYWDDNIHTFICVQDTHVYLILYVHEYTHMYTHILICANTCNYF